MICIEIEIKLGYHIGEEKVVWKNFNCNNALWYICQKNASDNIENNDEDAIKQAESIFDKAEERTQANDDDGKQEESFQNNGID